MCKRVCGHGMFGKDESRRCKNMASDKKTQGLAMSQLRFLTAKKYFLALKNSPPTGAMCDHECHKRADCKGEDCGLMCRLIQRDRRPCTHAHV
mmetsp:Transcript_49066/g.114076  ORF Transcript_49066/g.114076 Transcript_49066/m.114076 type:complete len:93 (+) Transcript_49066:219-497(+)